MCLNLNRQSKILTARRDIRVGKYLHREKGELKSPYFKTRWGKTQAKIEDSFTDGYGFYINELKPFTFRTYRDSRINKGLHSYDSRESKRRATEKMWGKMGKMYEAIIPKGTKYIRGKNGEIVSLGLKLTGRLFR